MKLSTKPQFCVPLAALAAAAITLASLASPGLQAQTFSSPLPSPSSTASWTLDRDPRPPMGPTLWVTPPVTPTPLVNATPTALAMANPQAVHTFSRYSSSTIVGGSQVYMPLVFGPINLNYGRKGIGDDWRTWQPERAMNGTNLNELNFEWYYDWTWRFLPDRGPDPRYARMIWDDTGFWFEDVKNVWRFVGDVAQGDEDSGLRGRVWLIYNEPDDLSQANIPDAVHAADYYVTAYNLIKEHDQYARVFGGGLLWLNTEETRLWWETFVKRLKDTKQIKKLEGVHIHLYPQYSTAPTRKHTSDNCSNQYCMPELAQVANDWYQRMHLGLGLTEDQPLWITEAGWLLYDNGCTAQQYAEIRDNVMLPLSQWFDRDPSWPYRNQIETNPGYDAIAWYVSRDIGMGPTDCSYLLDSTGPSGEPTSLGLFWNGYRPE